MRDVFNAEPIIGVFLVFGRLDVDSPFGHSDAAGLRVLDHGSAPALGLHVRLENNNNYIFYEIIQFVDYNLVSF
jgi:hypothetical protein